MTLSQVKTEQKVQNHRMCSNSPRLPAPRDPIWRLHIDESGDHTYIKLEKPWHRYFCLLGVWIERGDKYNAFADSLTKIKRDIFGISADDKLVLHRSDIKGRSGIFGKLKDPEIDRRFCASLLNLVETTPFVMVSAIVDKKSHLEKYSDPLHPYHYALTVMIERYAFWLSENRTCGDAMAESRGKEPDRELEAEYRKIATSGTKYLKSDSIKKVLTSKELKMRSKDHDIAGLQLADILAHPVKCEALIERDLCKPAGGFAKELAAAARPKYRGFYKGRVTGYGRVWL